MRHPAHQMDFDTLTGGLASAMADGHVYERRDGDLSLFCYTKSAVYNEAWTPITKVARGLVLDRVNRRIAATPFPKFFNLGEGGHAVPDGEFEIMEKLDGSLIIAFNHDGKWRTVTKGDFESAQAVAARELLPFADMQPNLTWLTELIGPENKIVARYNEDECCLLSAFDSAGSELTPSQLASVKPAGMKTAQTHPFRSVDDLIAQLSELTVNEEGYVPRFACGTRLKLKGNAYKRVHAMISNLTPLTVWRAMLDDDVDAMRKELPEEFWGDFDQIHGLLEAQKSSLMDEIQTEAKKWSDVSDRELGQALKSVPDPARKFLFALRKGQMMKGRTKESFFKMFRPAENQLEGYVPSYARKRAQEEMQG